LAALILLPLGLNAFKVYTDKHAEFTAKDPLYCPLSSCSMLLSTDISNLRATGAETKICESCSTSVCMTCRQSHPTSTICPEDAASLAVVELAREEGWQRCTSCSRYVELRQGCNHMTCVCTHQFCYVCGVHWKNCDCPQWEETRLFAAAERRVPAVAVAARNAPGAVAARANQVRNAAAHIATYHACDHDEWSLLQGGNECEICHNYMDRYILQCDQCLLLACVRCSRHRL